MRSSRYFGARRSAAGFALAVVLAVFTGIVGVIAEKLHASGSIHVGAPPAWGTPCLLLVEASCTPQPSAAGNE